MEGQQIRSKGVLFQLEPPLSPFTPRSTAQGDTPLPLVLVKEFKSTFLPLFGSLLDLDSIY